MAASGDNPVLSNKQKQFTIRAVKKKPLKAAVCNPYNIAWPHVSNADCSFVLGLLEREFGAIELRKTSWILRNDQRSEYKAFKKLKPAKKKEMLSSLHNQRTEEEVNLMSQLVIGFQKVNKYLERDELRLVLANRESWLLIQHLALLVGIRKCPGMALPGLEHCLANRLGVSKLSAVGFKKKRPGDSNKFDKLVDEITSRCPAFHIPWLEMEKELLSIKSSSVTTDNENSSGPSGDHQLENDRNTNAEEQPCDLNKQSSLDGSMSRHSGHQEDDSGQAALENRIQNYASFYQYKSETQKKGKIIFEEKCKSNIIRVKYDGIDNLDFIPVDDVEMDCTKRKRKNKSSSNLRKKKLSRQSTWQTADVGQMVGNPDRKQSKKKIK